MTEQNERTTLWGGRFTSAMDVSVREFNDSLTFDQRLAASDIAGCLAYATALRDAGLLDQSECEVISDGLGQIRQEFEQDGFLPRVGDEDIHTAIERRLYELAGPAAGKLHTGRSRNDQVATALRHHLLGIIDECIAMLRSFQSVLVHKAEIHLDIVMPGYTHLQRAQPILFSHWLLSFFWKFERDIGRLEGARTRSSVCPLGSGALAGNPFNVDRRQLAKTLGFARVSENSLDAVEDRDFVVEFLFACTMIQTHLSSLSETMILWSSEAYAFVDLNESYCTGSSLMPQKRNPDLLELIRGKSGRVFGHLMGMITTLKGLPSGYNKDLQEDKEGLFDVIDTVMAELPIAEAIVGTMTPNAARMAAACSPSMMATDLADYLVLKGIPFRDAHYIVGCAVQQAEHVGVSMDKLPLCELKQIHSAFEEDVARVFDVQTSIERRQAKGGTGRRAVLCQIQEANSILDQASDDRSHRHSLRDSPKRKSASTSEHTGETMLR